ncbi:hypothetical protein DFS34DRAFT_692255 [Phlyctochytrium arcticum]|nr:hypothetical protein DFS34DRAFT_692255 [Phlyctochytrium arcticum]
MRNSSSRLLTCLASRTVSSRNVCDTSRRAAHSGATSLLVSSPHSSSHIRLFRHPSGAQRKDQPEVAAWHLHRQKVQVWHHQFWELNNQNFQAAKQAFETKLMEASGRPATPTELSQFYQQYLNESYSRHRAYNAAWLQENFNMLRSALAAELAVLGHTTETWWLRFGHSIIRVGGGFRAHGVTVR